VTAPETLASHPPMDGRTDGDGDGDGGDDGAGSAPTPPAAAAAPWTLAGRNGRDPPPCLLFSRCGGGGAAASVAVGAGDPAASPTGCRTSTYIAQGTHYYSFRPHLLSCPSIPAHGRQLRAVDPTCFVLARPLPRQWQGEGSGVVLDGRGGRRCRTRRPRSALLCSAAIPLSYSSFVRCCTRETETNN
jgi:hypothetical protein